MTVLFSATFDAALSTYEFIKQEKAAGRVSIITSPTREGGHALQLHTEVGDTGVVVSNGMERCDVYLAEPGTSGAPVLYGEGVEQWWAHSVYLPDDFAAPNWTPYVLADFHNDGDSAAASFHLNFRRNPTDDSLPGSLQFQGFYGDPAAPTEYYAIIGLPTKNIWYDLVYHVKWSSGADGFFYAWANGVRVLSHEGPTLYAGQKVYFKLANYHLPPRDAFPEIDGPHVASSVIHDRVILGTTAEDVAIGSLQYNPASLSDVLKAATVKPVYIGFFDIDADPIRAWTGPGVYAPTTTGDADLDGFTFNSAAQLLRVSDFTENDGLSDSFSLTFSIADDELDPYAQLVANRAAFQGRRVVIWLAFMNEDESAVMPYIERKFVGVMTAASMQRLTGSGGELTLTCDHDLQKARVAPTRWIDHQFFNPTDTATSFINDLARGPVTAESVAATTPQTPSAPPPNWGNIPGLP